MSRYSESKAQQTLVQWWAMQHRTLGVRSKNLLFAIPNGARRDVMSGARLKAEGLRAGAPDLLLLVPRGPYHGLAIEMKTAAGRVSENQKQFQLDLMGQGYHAVIARGWEEAARSIENYIRLEQSQ